MYLSNPEKQFKLPLHTEIKHLELDIVESVSSFCYVGS